MSKNKGVMGRPRKTIDQEDFENLCRLQCTQAEICSFFKVSDQWLLDWCKRTYNGKTFLEVYKLISPSGNVSLRRNLFKLSQKSSAVAIFLAKNYLGMRDFGVANDPDQTIEDINAVLDEACSESESEG